MADKRRPDSEAPAYEVLVDTWGHRGELVRGDIVSRGDLDGYDVDHAVRMGVVRELTDVEPDARVARPTASTTELLTPSGEIDADLQARLRSEAGAAPATGASSGVSLPPVASGAASGASSGPAAAPSAATPSGSGDAVFERADLSDEQRSALRDAGFGDADAIRAASDEELLKVPGVGPAAVRRLREASRE